jgi:hypothetical protein
MWRRRKPARDIAQQLASRFGGVVEENRSSLEFFWFVVRFRYHGMDVVTEVHATTASLRLSVDKCRNKCGFACSFGEPANPGFARLPTDIFGGEPIRVFAPCSRTAADVEAILAFLSDPKNRRDIVDLRLVRGERLALYVNGIEASFATANPETLSQRLDAIAELFHRNRKLGKLKLFSGNSRQMIPGAPLGAAATDNAGPTRHTFGGDITAQLSACVNCNAPLHLLATLDAHDPELAVKRRPQRWLHILTCLNCDSYASPLFWKREDEVFEVLQQARGQSFGEFPPFLEERELRLAPVGPQRVDDGTRSPRHRIGGPPDWIQAEYVPVCPECGIDMAFVAQIDTDDDLNIQFSDNGILYAFICQTCGIMSSFAQGY